MTGKLYLNLNDTIVENLMLDEGRALRQQGLIQPRQGLGFFAFRDARARFELALNEVFWNDRKLFYNGDCTTDRNCELAELVKEKLVEDIACVRVRPINQNWLKLKIIDAHRKLVTASGGHRLCQLIEGREGADYNEPAGDGEPAVNQVGFSEAANREEFESILSQINPDDLKVDLVKGRLITRRRVRAKRDRLTCTRQVAIRTWVQYALDNGGGWGFAHTHNDLFPLNASPKDMSQAVTETGLEVYFRLQERHPELPPLESGDEACNALANFLKPSGTERLEERKKKRKKRPAAPPPADPGSARSIRPVVETDFRQLAAGDEDLQRLVRAYHDGLTKEGIARECYGQTWNNPALHPRHASDLRELAGRLQKFLKPGNRYVIGAVDMAQKQGQWTPVALV